MSGRARRIAAAWAARGHHVRFIVPADAAPRGIDAVDGVALKRVDVPARREAHWSMQARARMRRAQDVATSHFGDKDADVVVTCQPEFAAALRNRRSWQPIVLVACCSQVLYRALHRETQARRNWSSRPFFALNARWLERGEGHGMRAADAVAFDSDMTRRVAGHVHRLDPTRCHVVPPTCDTRRFAPAAESVRAARRSELRIGSREFVVAWSGRMTYEKNVALLLDAAARTPRCVDRLLLIGDGPDCVALKRRAVELGIAERVIFAGLCEEPADWLAAADAFVLPSRVDSFGVAVIEAMACGLPCVVTGCVDGRVYCGAAESVVDGETGFVLPDAVPEVLADMLKRLASDRRLAQRFGMAGRRRVEDRYALGRDGAELERIVQAVLGGEAPVLPVEECAAT